MIKQTFYNLDEEKKRRILDAAKKEFTSVPINEAKISRIIKDAGIPRGSFYQYFDTIEDVLDALIEDAGKSKRNSLFKFLEESDGDIFEAFLKLFEVEYDLSSNIEMRDLFKNIFETMGQKRLSMMKQIKVLEMKQIKEHLSNIDLSNFNVSSPIEFIPVMRMIVMCMHESMRFSLTMNLSKEEARKNLERQFEIIKYGVYKK